MLAETNSPKGVNQMNDYYTEADTHYRDDEADTSRTYWIVEENGDVIAEIKLPSTYKKADAYAKLNRMARAIGAQWTD